MFFVSKNNNKEVYTTYNLWKFFDFDVSKMTVSSNG